MRYTIKESQYKRLIKLISEQEEEGTTDQTTGATITKAAAYGDISKVGGSETDKVASATAGQLTGKNVFLYNEKELKTKQGSTAYVLKSITNDNGKVELNMGNFIMTTDCSRVPNDNSFDYGSKKYYSTELANYAAEKCKTQQ